VTIEELGDYIKGNWDSKEKEWECRPHQESVKKRSWIDYYALGP